jgi:hypothetical protein
MTFPGLGIVGTGRFGTLRRGAGATSLIAGDFGGGVSGSMRLLGGAAAWSGDRGTLSGAAGAQLIVWRKAVVSGRAGVEGLIKMPARRLIKLRRAVVWVSLCGASGEFGEDWANVCTMSCKLERIMLLEALSGIHTFVGNHVTVSQICLALISHIQIW